MGKVEKDNIKIGMVLSRPILNTHGGMLINKGVELQENHLRLLKMWGINEIYIENPEEDKYRQQNLTQLLKNYQLEIDFMFKGKTTPLMDLIKKFAKKQLRKELEALL